MKNLYLVSQDVNRYYNTYDSFVIRCDTEQEARMTHPDGFLASHVDGEPDANGWKQWWDDGYWVSRDDLDKVKVEHIGVALDSMPYGIVCTSFNAG